MSALLISTHLYEKRPLKKPKLGPPDVYPQDPKQKEDELTATNVKQGYSNGNLVPDEYGTARNANITYNRFGEYFSAVLAKKHELNTFSDTSRKKQTINKESALYVTAKTKNSVESWFKDLAANTKSLAQLSKKVPIFNKKEEIFSMLYDFFVPMIKAQWYLKLASAQQMAMSESNNKSKKRQMPDLSQEWTSWLCRFLKEHYHKIIESMSSNNHNLNLMTSSIGNTLNQPPLNTKELLNQWLYYTQLTRYLYEEGLLERFDFLTWLLEIFEKIKSIEDLMLNLIVPLLVQYIDEFILSEMLSRRLALICAKKISQLVVEYSVEINIDSEKENNLTSNTFVKDISTSEKISFKIKHSPNDTSITSIFNSNNLSSCFREIISCSKHRSIMFGFSNILQVITLECPTALVWINSGTLDFNLFSNLKNTLLLGSPLDYLPCEPSNLPIPLTENTQAFANKIRRAENLIKHRSSNSENKWFFKIFKEVSASKSVGNIVSRLLHVLDCLDKHLFHKISLSNSLDTLYGKIFDSLSHIDSSSVSQASNTQQSTNKDALFSKFDEHCKKSSDEIIEDDLIVVKLLCEWAVTTKRLGEFRSRVVAKLLERRQNEILTKIERITSNCSADSSNTNNKSVETEIVVSADHSSSNLKNSTCDSNIKSSLFDKDNIPIYQNVLFDFLDQCAPMTEDKSLGIYLNTNTFPINSSDTKQAFNNLILLFSELIRHDVFSHDIYMCTLISRGHFVSPPNISLLTSTNSNHSIKNNSEDSLTGLLPSNMDSVSNGLVNASIHKSTSSSSLPMFDPLSNNSNLNCNETSGSNFFSMSNDNQDEDKLLDEDLGKILQNIKAGQQSLNDQNDAMESDKEDEPSNSVSTNSLSDLNSVSKNHSSESQNAASRHLLYTLHFPLPQDEFFNHECNQRHILLYGVGKTKDEARHIVKKVTKEIQKLFNRKTSIDINDNGKVKKHVIKEGYNFENAIAKFQNLSIFDQHAVTNSCASNVLEMLNGVVLGNAYHLPLIESIAFLFDLMEVALNVHGLVEFIVQMLKELLEVESVLQQKCSLLARIYCTSIGLYIVGVLNRYHNHVVASTEDVVQVFDGLWKLVRHVPSPSDCSSAERCIFFYLYDMNCSCAHVLKKYNQVIEPVISKIKAMFNYKNELALSAFNTPCVMMQYLKNPKEKVDSLHIRQLNENASDRYSLVFNTICCIVEANDMDYLNELSVLCAELTSSCSALFDEWFNAFKALCYPTKNKNEYSSLLSQTEDRAIYDNLAVFISILVARRCFCLENFILQVCVPSLLIPTIDSSDEAEKSARLTCHLILYLFKYYDSPLAASNSAMNSSFASSSRYSLTSPGPLGLATVVPPIGSGQKPPFVIKYACDRYLLGGALNSLRIEHILVTLLKAIFVLGTQLEKNNGNKNFKTDKSDYDSIYKSIDDFTDLSYLSQISKTKMDSTEKPSLSDFAKYVLHQICMQDWVHDRCLRGFMVNPKTLVELLFDKRFTHKDSQYLLNMICYHKQIVSSSVQVNDKSDSKQIIRVFQNLDEWSIRISWLQLYLIYEQLVVTSQSNNSNEINSWFDTLARAVVEYFQQSCQSELVLDRKLLTLFTSKSSTKNTSSLNFGNSNCPNERIWLVAPLIENLSKVFKTLHSKILRVAASFFDQSSWIFFSQVQSNSMSSKLKSGFQGSKSSNNYGITMNSQNCTSTLLSYQPFVALLLMCLKSKDDHEGAILSSIYTQISQCINEKLSDDIKSKKFIQEGLQMRLSLVGATFEKILSTSTLTNDWALLLLQLISYTIVDPHIDFDNFTTVLDMLNTLMHASYVTNLLPEQREETKKQYQNLIKKLKKELNIERMVLGSSMAKQLLSFAKYQAEVITCEPMGSLVDTKGNKIAGFDSIDKKQGLQVAEKQKISPWDLIEGHKNSAPLSWTWFGGIRMERKPLRTEENFSLLSHHNHSICKPTSYYIEPPPIPPEDDPVPPNPIQPFPFTNNNIPNVLGQNGSNMAPSMSMHLNTMPNHHVTAYNPGRLHPLSQQQQTANLNQSLPPQYHLTGIPPNNVPQTQIPTLQSSGPSNGSLSMNPPQAQHQMMNSINNDNQSITNQNNLMMNSLNSSNSSMMSNMTSIDMIDTLTTGLGNPHLSQMGIPPMNSLRHPISSVSQLSTPMSNVGPRAQTKQTKAKTPNTNRRRRNAKGSVNLNNSLAQQTPIRMLDQASANNQMNQPTSSNNTSWSFQNHNMINQQPTNQNFYSQSTTNNSNQSGMAMTHQPPRFQDQSMHNNASKARLRAMLNTRHPNVSQFGQNIATGNTSMNVSNQMINNGPQQSSSMLSSNIYQPRPPLQQQTQMVPRPSMRPQQMASGPNQPMNNLIQNQSSQLFQQQPPQQSLPQMNHQSNNGSIHLHQQSHPSSQQQSSFVQPNQMAFNPNVSQQLDGSGGFQFREFQQGNFRRQVAPSTEYRIYQSSGWEGE